MKKFVLNQPTSQKHTRRKMIIGVLVSAIILLGLVVFLHFINIINLPFLSSGEETASSNDSINYDPPTKEEKEAGDETKNDHQDKPYTASNSQVSSTKKPVTPIIISVGQDGEGQNVNARGLIPDVFESGGTCTLNLSRGELVVSESRPAVVDAQSVTCGLLEISRTKLSAGEWMAYITYTSGAFEGRSNESKVSVL